MFAFAAHGQFEIDAKFLIRGGAALEDLATMRANATTRREDIIEASE
jgi:hypothetical protein